MIQRAAIVGLILAATLATYASLGGATFTLWDDVGTIWRNERFNPPSVDNLAYYWAHPHMELYVPVTYSVWQLLGGLAWMDEPDTYSMRLDASVYHVANIVIHAASAVLVWLLLRRLVKHDWAAAAGALLFALHPVQVEPVAWVSGTKDLLMGFFVLLAVWQYVRFADQSQAGNARDARGHYALAMLAFILGVLSKPTAVVAPLLALTLDTLIVRRPARRIALALAPWLAVSIGMAVVTRLVQPTTYVDGGPLWARPIIALDALAFYLWNLLFPLHLTIDYGRTPRHVLSHWWGYATWVVPVAMAAWLWVKRRQWPLLGIGAMWLVIALLPVLGLTSFLFQIYSTTADHYLYLSMAGVGLAAAALVARNPTRTVAIACAIVLGLLAVRSFVQSRHWHDSMRLFTHAVALNHGSMRMQNNLSTAYDLEADACLRRGQREEAMDWYRRAEQRYRLVLAAEPGAFQARNNLAMNLGKQGRYREALAELEEGWRLRDIIPPEQRAGLLDLPRLMGLVELNLGDYDKAVHWLEEAQSLHPTDPEIDQKLQEARQKARDAPPK